MTPKSQDKNDTKLLLSVAAVVVAGATGLAILASLGVDREERAAAPRTTRAAERVLTATPAVAPSSSAPSPSNFDGGAIELASLEPVPRAEEAGDESVAERFRVDPDADFVAEGTRAYRSGDYPVAAAYFAAETEAREDRAWSHYMLGLSRWKSGDRRGAASAMERSVELDPGSIKGWINLSRIRNDAGEFEAAHQAAVEAVALDDSDAESHFLLGRSLRNLNRVDEALVALERSIEIAPDNGHARNLLGLTLLEQGREAEAVSQLELAAERIPEVAYVQNNLGMALELVGRRDEAVACYRRAGKIDPAHERSAANLARLEEPVAGVTDPLAAL